MKKKLKENIRKLALKKFKDSKKVKNLIVVNPEIDTVIQNR